MHKDPVSFNAYQPWESARLHFTKTYHVDGNSPQASDAGPGDAAQPFRTINAAAQVLQPGERVVVIAGGIYRESIHPRLGGSGPEAMISYEAAPGEEVIVKGSLVLADQWQPSTGWSLRSWGHAVKGNPNIWQRELQEL